MKRRGGGGISGIKKPEKKENKQYFADQPDTEFEAYRRRNDRRLADKDLYKKRPIDRDKAVDPQKFRNDGYGADETDVTVDGMVWRKQKKPGMTGKTKAAIIFVAAVLLFGMGYFCFRFMRVEHIDVDGASNNEDSVTVIGLSGIETGTHIFSVDQKKAEEGINSDPYFVYESFEYVFPNSVTLHVKKRNIAAAFEYVGKLILIDENGYALDKINGNSKLNVPQLFGLGSVAFESGYEIRLDTPERLTALKNLLKAINSSSLKGTIKSIDMSDMKNVILTNGNGMKINIGEDADYDVKARFAASVIKRLQMEGKTTGTLDARSKARISYYEEGSDKSRDIIS